MVFQCSTKDICTGFLLLFAFVKEEVKGSIFHTSLSPKASCLEEKKKAVTRSSPSEVLQDSRSSLSGVFYYFVMRDDDDVGG